MAHLPHRRHGSSPQGHVRQLPWVTKPMAPDIPSETSSNPATRAQQLEKQQPAKDLATLLKRIRIPQEAQGILGNSSVPVVSLERLDVRALLLPSSLQPVVSLVRLPLQTEPRFCCRASGPDPEVLNNSVRQERSVGGTGPSDPDAAPLFWTEPYDPDGSTSEEREQDSGFDCESLPDQPFILFDSGSEGWDPDEETFYLDPDPEQTVVIQLDPDLQTDQDPGADTEVKCDVDVVQEDDGEDQRPEEVDLSHDHSEPGPEDMEEVNGPHGPEYEEIEEPEHEDMDGPEHEEIEEPGPEDVDGPEHEDMDGPEHEEIEEPGSEDVDGPEHEEIEEPGPEDVDGPEHEEIEEPGLEDVDGPEHEDMDGPEHEEIEEPGSEDVDGSEHEKVHGPEHGDMEPGPEEVDRPESDRWKEVESEDFCAVCLNGGDLLCCDRCPRVYHLSCHLPPLSSFPQGDWACTLCRTDQEPVHTYDCEDVHSCRGARAPYTLSHQEQRRCEKLALQLYSHALSGPFQQPVSPLAQNYYQIIRRPVDLSVIRRKLDESNTLHYFSVEQFVDDVLLMFRNCATFNYPDSEVGQAGQSLERFFLSQLREVFPNRTFPNANQEAMDRARRRWLRKRRRRRRRSSLRGQKYCL